MPICWIGTAYIYYVLGYIDGASVWETMLCDGGMDAKLLQGSYCRSLLRDILKYVPFSPDRKKNGGPKSPTRFGEWGFRLHIGLEVRANIDMLIYRAGRTPECNNFVEFALSTIVP